MTPKDRIFKVMSEEKVFQTWYSGRTALLDDACHKLNPSGAHGAVTAMHDALALANLVYALPKNSAAAIEEAFSEYYIERIGPVTASFNASKPLSMVTGRGIIGKIALFLRKYTPLFIWDTVIHLNNNGNGKPRVLIVGAGLGGLMLGALLEKAGISYAIFERTAEVKPLGIEEEFIAMGRPTPKITVNREGGPPLYVVSSLPQVKYTGYYSYIVSRPLFYDLLMKQVPVHKIHFNKRVLTISDKEDQVKIQTSDNCVYEGDILVGADGAYSAVRQRMYETLKQEGRLPKSDQEDLPFHSTCLVGQTEPIDLKDFPEFQEPLCSFYNTMGKDSPHTWVVFATAQKTLCYMVIHHLDKASSKAAEEHRFRESENSQWGPHAAQAMVEETRHFPLAIGTKKMTMGDLYDLTPKDRISKVMLEEKVFQTWHSGRIALLGDGAITAMHDSIALANLIYALAPNATTAEIEKSLEEYRNERIVPVTESYNTSKSFSKIMERGIVGMISLCLFKNIPLWLLNMIYKRQILSRPQCGFLEEVPLKGSVKALRSPSTEKARAVYKKRMAAVSI
ncbi:hypothetical protein BGZ95_000648 [Linnemannia exigua]|uniref:FAD-binding domain-containing protein n=1 Tax=Linnemannia exigua TaxID=604196 RepID=A0AAD4D8A2_9FUNG|nr:hypothetical protein BGZ95_000648 [Linnemannia exigua]